MSMKRFLKNIIDPKATAREKRYKDIFSKFSSFTMLPEQYYIANLKIAEKAMNTPGDVVECGVWRGGMSAGMASILGKSKSYFLYDSFEGLPPAKEIDGEAALNWQSDTKGEAYYENCKAEMGFAQEAMNKTGVKYSTIKGWFDDTVPNHQHDQISVLRLDGDWYDSTMVCLKHLYPKVVKDGIIIIDDYYTWDGCSKAVHDYLSSIQSASRIFTGYNKVAYIIKKDQ